MPRYIIKLDDQDKSYYLEYSTIVDAPVTFGMSLAEFTAYYKENNLPERLERVEAKGVSALDYKSVDELLVHNRAGKDETCLSKEQIIEWFCRRQDDQNLPYGRKYNPDTEEYEEVPVND